MLSLNRIASFDVEGCTFMPGGRGMVISAEGVRIVNNTFKNLHAAAILFLEGGCGAYEDYTEGPFSKNILVEGNTITMDPLTMKGPTQGEAPIQFGGCIPPSCKDAPPPPPPPPPPLPPAPAGSVGPTLTGNPYFIPATFSNISRFVSITLPTSGGEEEAVTVSSVAFYDGCVSPRLSKVVMGVYTAAAAAAASSAAKPTGPMARLALVEFGSTCTEAGWRSATVSPPVAVPPGKEVWLGHWYAVGAWQSAQTEGTHKFSVDLAGLPESVDASRFKVFATSGLPLRLTADAAGDDSNRRDTSGRGGASMSVGNPRVPEPYPLPPCDRNGGSSIPPVVQHSGDPEGDGRIQEPGYPLADGNMIYSNITIRNNTVLAMSSTAYFLDVGATNGLVVEGNTFYTEDSGTFENNIYIYSSKGFDRSAIATTNKCGHVDNKAAAGPCVVQVPDVPTQVLRPPA